MEDKSRSLNETLSRNLQAIYAFRKKSMEEFSSELGIGHTTLQNIFHRRSNLRLDTVEVIADKLNMTPVELLSEQYPKESLTCSVLLLETLELFQPMTRAERRKAAVLFCQLLELIPEPGEPVNG